MTDNGIASLIRTHVSPEGLVPRANYHGFRFSGDHSTRHEAEIRLVEQMVTASL